MLQQHLQRIGLAGPRRQHQRRIARVGNHRIGIFAGLQQLLDHGRAAVGAGQRQRRGSKTVSGFYVCARADQHDPPFRHHSSGPPNAAPLCRRLVRAFASACSLSRERTVGVSWFMAASAKRVSPLVAPKLAAASSAAIQSPFRRIDIMIYRIAFSSLLAIQLELCPMGAWRSPGFGPCDRSDRPSACSSCSCPKSQTANFTAARAHQSVLRHLP